MADVWDDKEIFLDSEGRPLTQSLFLEIGYNLEYSIYTLKRRDYEFKGKKYISLYLKFIEMMDITEYEFASKYFLGWSHWKRISEHKYIKKHVVEWREELEMNLRCEGIKQIRKNASNGGFQAAKWLTDKGWDVRGAGRPSKEAVEREKRIQARISDEFTADIIRLKEVS